MNRFQRWLYRRWYSMPWFSAKYVQQLQAAHKLLMATRDERIQKLNTQITQLTSERNLADAARLQALKMAKEAIDRAANMRIELSSLLHNDRRIRELIQSSIQRLSDGRPRTIGFMAFQEPCVKIESGGYSVGARSTLHADMLTFSFGFALHPEAEVEFVIREVGKIIAHAIEKDLAIAYEKQSMLR